MCCLLLHVVLRCVMLCVVLCVAVYCAAFGMLPIVVLLLRSASPPQQISETAVLCGAMGNGRRLRGTNSTCWSPAGTAVLWCLFRDKCSLRV